MIPTFRGELIKWICSNCGLDVNETRDTGQPYFKCARCGQETYRQFLDQDSVINYWDLVERETL